MKGTWLVLGFTCDDVVGRNRVVGERAAPPADASDPLIRRPV